MLNLADFFHALEVLAVASAVAAQHYDDAAIVVSRSPEPVALVIANRFGKSVLGAEKVDRARLAVTVGEDGCAFSICRRQRVIDPGYFADHVFPAEFIGEVLRQRSIVLVLRFCRFDTDPLLVTNECFRREHRSGDRREQGAANQDY